MKTLKCSILNLKVLNFGKNSNSSLLIFSKSASKAFKNSLKTASTLTIWKNQFLTTSHQADLSSTMPKQQPRLQAADMATTKPHSWWIHNVENSDKTVLINTPYALLTKVVSGRVYLRNQRNPFAESESHWKKAALKNLLMPDIL